MPPFSEQPQPEIKEKTVIKITAATAAGRYPDKPGRRNEDSIEYDADAKIVVIADGMGGRRGGGQASRIAADSLFRMISAADGSIEELQQQLIDAFVEVDEEIKNVVYGGGTTATVLKIVEEQGQLMGVIGSAGDSPIFLLRDNRLTQLTEDDHEPNMPHNFISNAIGFGARANIATVSLKGGDKLICATDGLTKKLTAEQMMKIVTKGGDAGRILLEALKNSRDPDDTTVCLVEIPNKVGPAPESVWQKLRSSIGGKDKEPENISLELNAQNPDTPYIPLTQDGVIITLGNLKTPIHLKIAQERNPETRLMEPILRNSQTGHGIWLSPDGISVFGRGQIDTAEILGLEQDKSVSRNHFAVTFKNGEVSIRDTSTNGMQISYKPR